MERVKTQRFCNEIQVSYVNIGGVRVGLVECNGKPLKFTQSLFPLVENQEKQVFDNLTVFVICDNDE